ncbi:MAG TPA: glycoside hydrolase family 130 protein [Prosthecobacter sp.]|nr:glycoside hydrolase family 130 protein [Prosthecobacter sp.]
MNVRRCSLVLRPDPRRVLIRRFWPAASPTASDPANVPRALKIMTRVLALTEEEAEAHWVQVCSDFNQRHPDLDAYFIKRFSEVAPWLPSDAALSDTRKKLIGSYFTHEYSIEAAALFNPSIVPSPDQSGVPEGGLRFILSLRAVGEGHISSICFRCGTLSPDFELDFGEPARWVIEAELDVDTAFDVKWFHKKCRELGVSAEFTESVCSALPDPFNESQLEAAVRQACSGSQEAPCIANGERLLMLAKSNFSVSFPPASRYSERAIFPISPSQTNGIEDARFVRFAEDDGSVTYYATYTAYDGRVIFPQMLETRDFIDFHFRTLQGSAVQNKGMALFPRRVGGRYVMLSRQDSENIRIMYSDDLYHWDNSDVLVRPTQPWEFVQLGNCGSPIELDEGWLVLTHGVGAMRKYCIGAILLDKDDPSQVIGRLTEPLIRPAPEEREGYVPNVVYTCGGLIHRGHLFLPYATSDWYTSFAYLSVSDLIAGMK